MCKAVMNTLRFGSSTARDVRKPYELPRRAYGVDCDRNLTSKHVHVLNVSNLFPCRSPKAVVEHAVAGILRYTYKCILIMPGSINIRFAMSSFALYRVDGGQNPKPKSSILPSNSESERSPSPFPLIKVCFRWEEAMITGRASRRIPIARVEPRNISKRKKKETGRGKKKQKGGGRQPPSFTTVTAC